nr:hypothetical protein [Tanacetum cinerariifolium]
VNFVHGRRAAVRGTTDAGVHHVERDDEDTERPDKRRGGSDNHHSSNNNYSGSNNRLNFKSIQSPSTHEHDPNTTV